MLSLKKITLLLLCTISAHIIAVAANYQPTLKDNALIDYATTYITSKIAPNNIPLINQKIQDTIEYKLTPERDQRLIRILSQLTTRLQHIYATNSTNTICSHTVCIDTTLPYQTSSTGRSQTISSEDDIGEYEETITISKDKKNITISGLKPMTNYDKTITMLEADRRLYQNHTSSCGGTNIKQEIQDNTGQTTITTVTDIANNIPETITIGDITYYATLHFNEDYSIADINDLHTIEQIFQPTDNIGDLIYLDMIKKDNRQLYTKYIVRIAGYDADIMYQATIKQPLRIIYLGTDTSYLKSNINTNNELMDLEVTNTILGYYKDNIIGIVQGDTRESIQSVDNNDLPLFTVEKIDDKGYYAVYTTTKYKPQVFAEMCKPAVYVYTSQPQTLTMSIETQPYETFTHIIPDFTRDQSWTFSTTPDDRLVVDTQTVDYLYYALYVGDYHHNHDGWIVQGQDTPTFFADKLTQINFNQKEYADFIEYREDKFESDTYYFISFKFNDEIEKLVPLQFDQQPDQLFRVVMDAYEIGQKQQVRDHQRRYLYPHHTTNSLDKHLLQRFERGQTDFEVFERGGVLRTTDQFIVY